MTVMSSGIDEQGKGQTQQIAMACKEANVCGGSAIVIQSSRLTTGTSRGKREKSGLSWRAAVAKTVQNNRGEVL